MYTIVQLKQGTQQWHAYRQSRRNASESAAVLGLSPWMTPYQLWLVKTGRLQTPATTAMQRGTDLEPLARAAYELQTGHIMEPLVIEEGPYSASLDGMTLDGSLILEIKCPFRGMRSELWEGVSQGQVPQHYVIQIQHQLMVAGADTAHLWVFDGVQGILHTIERDEVCMQRIRDAWDQFMPYLDRDSPPPLADADTLIRQDEVWLQAARHYLHTKQAADTLSEQLETARQSLIGLAQHPKEQGGGVCVTRYWKQGMVDYKKVPQLQGVDLNLYRSKPRQEIRISSD
jgi:putative phage-type endonuclease